MDNHTMESIAAAVIVIAIFIFTPLYVVLPILAAALLYDHFMKTDDLYKLKEAIGMNKKRVEENMRHYRGDGRGGRTL